MMILIGVLAVFFAVVNQQAGILFGLSVVVGPAIAYMIARVHRVNQGGELPSKTERVLGEIAVTILAITTASTVCWPRRESSRSFRFSGLCTCFEPGISRREEAGDRCKRADG